jgi:ABC transporter, permease protein
MFSGMVYFSYTDNILGWTKWDYFSLVTTATIIRYGYTFFFIWGSDLSYTIVQGKLDYTLLRPLNSFWYYAFYMADFPSLINVILGIIVQGWIIFKYHIGFFQVIMYIIFVIIGIWFQFLMFNFSNMISFWVDKAEQILWIPETLSETSSQPASIYPKWIRCFLMWLLPILTSFNLPIDIIRGKVNVVNMLWFVGFVGAFTIANYRIWHAGLKKYQSSN